MSGFGAAESLARLGRRTVKLTYWAATFQLRRRLRARREAHRSRDRRPDRRSEYRAWIEAYDTLGDDDFDGLRDLAASLAAQPLVSVLMPVCDPPERFLRQAIESVRRQVYENWELCIADDASTDPRVREVLDEYAHADDRVRVAYRLENGGIAAASNSALELARGEFVGVLDHDDLLRPHSLLLVVREFARGPHVGMVYTDEDTIDEEGAPLGHFFKPDWNPALVLCLNYPNHFTVFRTGLVRGAGGFRGEFDGSQDWDLVLRVADGLPAEEIAHVPHVLYHWRAVEGSAATRWDAKPYAIHAGRRAVEAHLERTGRHGYVQAVGRHQQVRLHVAAPRPLVSVVVPSTGRSELLGPCLSGLLDETAYREIEVVVVLSDETPSELTADGRVRTVVLPQKPFNYSRAVNQGAMHTQGSLVLLLNDDTEVVSEDWLGTMVGHVLQGDVGAVGPLLVFPDGSIQSAGMLIGARGAAEHLYHRRPLGISGYSGRARLTQDVSAVAGTCMLVKRTAYEEVGGFDESFPVCYNDIDFCLRLRQQGWRVLVTPDAVLRHHEMASFGSHQLGRQEEHDLDLARMHERWGPLFLDDPMHNPNLVLDASDPSRVAFPPRVTYPWREVKVGQGLGSSSSGRPNGL